MFFRVRAEGSRFWHSTQEELEEVPVPDGVKSIRTRVIEFTGKFEPVQWSCRAPLTNGKLCPRRDRYKVQLYLLYLILSTFNWKLFFIDFNPYSFKGSSYFDNLFSNL